MNTLIWTILAASQGAAAQSGGTPATGAAPEAGGSADPGGMCGGGLSPILMMALMFVVFYFILIRPQQKKAKEHTNMLNALQKGDNVVTRGGIIGKVSGVQDNIVTVELQEKVRVRVLKSYIEQRMIDKVPDSSTKADKKSDSSAESR